jgi:hypothetical protein
VSIGDYTIVYVSEIHKPCVTIFEDGIDVYTLFGSKQKQYFSNSLSELDPGEQDKILNNVKDFLENALPDIKQPLNYESTYVFPYKVKPQKISRESLETLESFADNLKSLANKLNNMRKSSANGNPPPTPLTR